MKILVARLRDLSTSRINQRWLQVPLQCSLGYGWEMMLKTVRVAALCIVCMGGLAFADATKAQEDEIRFALTELIIPHEPGTFNSRIGTDMLLLDEHLILAAETAQLLVFDISSNTAELIQVVDLADSSGWIQEAHIRLATDGQLVLVGAVGGYGTTSEVPPLQRISLFDWNDNHLHFLTEETSREDGPQTGFGVSVALTSGYAIVGEPENGKGLVHILDPAADLSTVVTLSAPDLEPSAFFGQSVAADSNLLAVAAPRTNAFPGGGDIRIFDLSDPSFPALVNLTFEGYDIGERMQWLDEQLFVHKKVPNQLNILRGQLAQIAQNEANEWSLRRIIEIPEQDFAEPSIEPALFVSEDELVAVARNLPGLFSGEFGIVRWGSPLGETLPEPELLITSAALGLEAPFESCCIGGLIAREEILFLADLVRPVRDLKTGGIIRLQRTDQSLVRLDDIAPTYPGFDRELARTARVSADGQRLYLSAPGWCEVLETDLDGAIIRRFQSPDDDNNCGRFGHAFALIEDRIYIGAPFTNAPRPNGGLYVDQGVIHGFELSSGEFVESLLPSPPDSWLTYGSSIAQHENRMLVDSAQGIEVWAISDGTMQLLQTLPLDFFITSPPTFAVSGSRLAIGFPHSFSGVIIALEWTGSTYETLPEVLDEPQDWGTALLWADHDTLIMGGSANSLRRFELLGGSWNERDPLLGTWQGFGRSLGRNPCGFLIADSGGVSRVNSLLNLPEGARRLAFADFDVATAITFWGGPYDFLHAHAQDYLTVPLLTDATNRRGGLFKLQLEKGLFRDRFESKQCSF